MASGKRDENNVVVGMGVSSVDGVTPVPITVDPVTGRLRVVSVSTDGGSASPTRTTAQRDQNNTRVAMAVTNDSNKTRTPLTVHNGALMMTAS